MTALLSEKELEHKADNATALFSVDPSDTFYWREILNHAKDEGFSSDVRGMATYGRGKKRKMQ